MIKIRLHGTMEEIELAISAIHIQFDVMSESELYADRGKNQYYRCYMDCKTKDANKANISEKRINNAISI